MTELTTSKVEGKQFYLGQLELSLIIKKIILHYKYHNQNNIPEVIIIPLLKEVECVKIVYEQESGMAKPGVSKPSSIHGKSNG